MYIEVYFNIFEVNMYKHNIIVLFLIIFLILMQAQM